MRGQDVLPPGRDRGERTPRGVGHPYRHSKASHSGLGVKSMRREDVPPSWGGPAVEQAPPQQHQLAQSAEFGKRVLRHLKHENDPYYDVVPLETVIRFRYESGTKRALAWEPEDESTKALRRLSISLRYGRMKCGCIGSHHWFAPCNPMAQADYEGELLGVVRP